jgi:hypothetical protein
MPSEPPAAEKVPDIKGDDRAAAEYILGIGGRVKVVGLNDYITTTEALPKRKFSLYDINVSNYGKAFIEPADADKLAGLQELKHFSAKRSVKDDEALRFLATCPSLLSVELENCTSLKGIWLRYLAPLRNIVSVSCISAAMEETSGFESFQSTNIGHLELRNADVTDSTMAAFGRFKKLRYLGLRDTAISDAGMAYLAALPDLTGLVVTHTAVTLDGIKSVGRAPLQTLGFGYTPEDMMAALPQLGQQFPKLETFHVVQGGATTAAQMTAIAAAWPKLKRIDWPSNHKFDADAFASASQLFPEVNYLLLWNGEITDQHIADIAQMKKLTTLYITGTRITDASLPALQKMKSLEALFIRETTLTEPAIKAFEKARPDVRIIGP